MPMATARATFHERWIGNAPCGVSRTLALAIGAGSAAAVAFYAMLALVPFLAVLLTLAVELLPDLTGSSGRRGLGNLTVEQFDATLREAFPPEVYEVVKVQIARLQQRPPVGLLSIGL